MEGIKFCYVLTSGNPDIRIDGPDGQGQNRRSNHTHHRNKTRHRKPGGVKINTRISTEGYQDSENSDSVNRPSGNTGVKSVSHSFKSDFDLAAVKAKYEKQLSDDDNAAVRLSRSKRQIRQGYRGPSLPRFAGIEHRFLREKIVGELGYPEGRLDRRAPPGFRTAGFTPVSLTDFSIASTGTAGRVTNWLGASFCLPFVCFGVCNGSQLVDIVCTEVNMRKTK